MYGVRKHPSFARPSYTIPGSPPSAARGPGKRNFPLTVARLGANNGPFAAIQSRNGDSPWRPANRERPRRRRGNPARNPASAQSSLRGCLPIGRGGARRRDDGARLSARYVAGRSCAAGHGPAACRRQRAVDDRRSDGARQYAFHRAGKRHLRWRWPFPDRSRWRRRHAGDALPCAACWRRTWRDNAGGAGRTQRDCRRSAGRRSRDSRRNALGTCRRTAREPCAVESAVRLSGDQPDDARARCRAAVVGTVHRQSGGRLADDGSRVGVARDARCRRARGRAARRTSRSARAGPVRRDDGACLRRRRARRGRVQGPREPRAARRRARPHVSMGARQRSVALPGLPARRLGGCRTEDVCRRAWRGQAGGRLARTATGRALPAGFPYEGQHGAARGAASRAFAGIDPHAPRRAWRCGADACRHSAAGRIERRRLPAGAAGQEQGKLEGASQPLSRLVRPRHRRDDEPARAQRRGVARVAGRRVPVARRAFQCRPRHRGERQAADLRAVRLDARRSFSSTRNGSSDSARFIRRTSTTSGRTFRSSTPTIARASRRRRHSPVLPITRGKATSTTTAANA